MKYQWTAMVSFGLLVTMSGCQSFVGDTKSSRTKKDSSWSWFKKPEYQTPRSLAVVWKEDTLTQPGKATVRGFGGRIYFYDERSKVIPVDGDLTIAAYDDAHKNVLPDGTEPADQTFRFSAKDFTEHFSESQFGASYSVWIPWDAVGGFQKKLTLIPTFLAKDGTIVQGQPSKVTLPGKSPSGLHEHADSALVQAASALIPTNTSQTMESIYRQGSQDSGLQTTTIQVPPSLNNHFSARSMNSNLSSVPGSQATTQGQPELTQQMADLRKQYYETTLRSLTQNGVLAPQSGPTNSIPANAAIDNAPRLQTTSLAQPTTGVTASFPKSTAPHFSPSTMPSNAFGGQNALGPFGPVSNDVSGPAVHSVWSQSQAPASTAAQSTSYPLR